MTGSDHLHENSWRDNDESVRLEGEMEFEFEELKKSLKPLVNRTAERTERFRRSYKYKHKQKIMLQARGQKINCDTQLHYNFRPTRIALILIIISIITSIHKQALAFCPLKCACNDLELWANCTQVQAISHVPMTLNPLLKRLTLSRLPLAELSNSLALYRQVEVLNLNGNQLRSIKYENFNFKSAPKVITLSTALSVQTARHLKHSIDKQLGVSSESAATQSSSTDSIRFHLRQLALADNKLEQLGADYQPSSSFDSPDNLSSSGQSMSLKAHELERLAPFLTLARLELLDLSGNKLTRLHQHVFLGLSRLRQLDLSRNQLEFLDQRAFVGLVELEQLSLASNKLLARNQQQQQQQQQFLQLGRSLCLGPLMELRQLDLSWNAPSSEPQAANILPGQMFACAPRLIELKLRALGLKYVQAGALEQLVELKSLDLSENSFELVPFSSAIREDFAQLETNSTEPQQKLVELKLSQTPIEFVSAHSLSARSLSQLERLEMRSMAQLVSFDLAALKPARLHLKQLLLDHNVRLQSFHSSDHQLAFPQLQLIDLNNAQELRSLQLDKMLDLRAPARHGHDDNQSPLQVDISQANNLNCSSCQMAWLIDSFKQRRLASVPGHAHLQLTPRPLQPQITTSNGWSPIPFDPYAPFVANSWPLPVRPTANQQRQINLINSDLINCAWPFSMPLIELINLETNYAPLFGVDPSCAPPVDLVAQAFPPPQPPPTPQLPARQPFRQHQQQHNYTHLATDSQPEVGLVTSLALLLAGLLVMGALVVVLFRLRRHIVRRKRRRRDDGDDVTRANESPASFTATTSIDSPQSSSTGSGAGGLPRPTAAAAAAPPHLIRNPLAVGAPSARQAQSEPNHYYYYVPTATSVQKSSHTLQNSLRVNNAPPPANHLNWTTQTRGQVDTIATKRTTRTTNTNNCRAFVDRNEEIKVRGNLFLRFVERLSAVGAAARRVPPLSSRRHHHQSHGFDFGAAARATPVHFPQGRGPGAQLYSNYATNGLLAFGIPASRAQPIYVPTGSGSGNNSSEIIQVDQPNHYSICGATDEQQDGDHHHHYDDTQLQLRNDNNYTNGHHHHQHLNQLQTIRDDYVTSGAAGQL